MYCWACSPRSEPLFSTLRRWSASVSSQKTCRNTDEMNLEQGPKAPSVSVSNVGYKRASRCPLAILRDESLRKWLATWCERDYEMSLPDDNNIVCCVICARLLSPKPTPHHPIPNPIAHGAPSPVSGHETLWIALRGHCPLSCFETVAQYTKTQERN